MVDFSAYLNFVCTDRRETRLLYTVTDVLLSREAQTVKQQKPGNGKLEESHQQVERFLVLTGLRKYALGEKREHVLLAGRPGSGKSTTLKQILLEMTEAALTDDTQPIPVLVQLKGNCPILEAIANELENGDLELEPKEIKRLLRQNRLVLLLDGINEIPSEDLRTKLQEFRDNNRTTPMIFTTRDLALGGDFGIEKRLEMCPLSEPQMREFVQKYLPEHGEMLLGQISDRLREVAETPLLLKMLCDVYSDPRLFEKVGDLKSKGELFRLFDQKYNNWKEREGVRTSEKFWTWNTELLQHLAFVMLQGDGLTKPRFTSDKNEAARLIEKYLTGRRVENSGDKAKDWLEDLVEHHLLQVAADARQIEFHHQLFQEYYAAEALLVMLQDKHSDVMDDQRLKHFYLNCLKWTEAIAMMLALLEDESQALRVVRLALEVDWMLGARLAGEVKLWFQEKTVWIINQLIADNQLSGWMRVKLSIQFYAHGMTSRSLTEDSNISEQRTYELQQISSTVDVFKCLEWLKNQEPEIRGNAAYLLGVIGSQSEVPVLCETAIQDESWSVRARAIHALARIGDPSAISTLIQIGRREDEDHSLRCHTLNSLAQFTEANAASILPDLRNLIFTKVGEAASFAIQGIQANCQFYNYEIAQWKPKPLPPSPTDILVKIDKTTQDTNRRTKQMADQPKNDFSGAIFQAPVNFGDKNQGNFIGTQNNYAAPQTTAAAQQLKTLLGKLRQKDPNATDEQLFDMLLNGFKTMPQQNPQNWQRWQDIFSILFAGGVEATKILVPVAGIPIEVLKRLYEIYQRHPKQLPGN